MVFRGQNKFVPESLLGFHDLSGFLLWADLLLHLQLLLLNLRVLCCFIFLFRYLSAPLNPQIADLLVHISRGISILVKCSEAKRRSHLNIRILPQGRDLDRLLVEVPVRRHPCQLAVQFMESFISVQVEFWQDLLLHVGEQGALTDTAMSHGFLLLAQNHDILQVFG